MAEPISRIEHLYLPPGLVGRTRFYSECDRAVIATIRGGVLFVMAFWSGPARLAFAQLKRVFEEVDLSCRLELVVVDTDGCPDLYQVLATSSRGADGRLIDLTGAMPIAPLNRVAGGCRCLRAGGNGLM